MVRWLALAAVVVAGAAAMLALALSGGSDSPAEALSPSDGQFVVECPYSHSAPDDPIVAPGDPGASHLHDYFGAVGVDAFTTAEDLRVAETTCEQTLDRASYWVPALYVDGEKQEPRLFDAYYRVAAGIEPTSVEPYPYGLMMISGEEYAGYGCGISLVTEQLPRDCPAGTELNTHIVFPSCWDGRSVDSADHRSHMAFPELGRCPDSHPVPVPELEMVITYSAVENPEDVLLASGGPETLHADFFNGWDPDKLQNEIEGCLHRELMCVIPDRGRPGTQIDSSALD